MKFNTDTMSVTQAVAALRKINKKFPILVTGLYGSQAHIEPEFITAPKDAARKALQIPMDKRIIISTDLCTG